MRSLICTSAVLLLIAHPLFAAAPSVKLAYKISGEDGATSLNREGSRPVSSFLSRLDLSSGSQIRGATLRVGLDRLHPDYRRYLIIDRQGNTAPLSAGSSPFEHSLRLGLDFFPAGYSLSLDGTKNLDASPFPGSAVSLAVSHDHYPLAARFGASLSHSRYRNPDSFFIQPETLRPLLRPNRVTQNQASVFWEQALSERWKSRLRLVGTKRPDDRPDRFGADGSLAWAFRDNMALVSQIGIGRERKGQELRDERGRFQATWAQTEIRFEPAYTWTLIGRLGTILEKESARGVAPARKVATDTVGLEARNTRRNFELGISGLGGFSNTGYRTYQLGGSLTWNL